MLHIFPSSQSFADWINKLFVCHIIRFSDSIQWVNVDNNFITIIVTPGKWIVDPVWNAILMKWFDFQQQIFIEFIFSIHRVALRFTLYSHSTFCDIIRRKMKNDTFDIVQCTFYNIHIGQKWKVTFFTSMKKLLLKYYCYYERRVKWEKLIITDEYSKVYKINPFQIFLFQVPLTFDSCSEKMLECWWWWW